MPGTRLLVIVRHAKSAWPPGVADHRRPLNDRGHRDAPAAGRWLAETLTDGVDLILHSPALRATDTAVMLAAELDPAPALRVERRLYPDGAGTVEDGPQVVLAIARDLPADVRTAVLVGHNPELEFAVRMLSGADITMRTSTAAVLVVSGEWADLAPGAATLTVTATPRG